MPEKLKINRLKVILAEKDISHKAFAEMIGVTPNTITRICNNDSQPTLHHLHKFALALDIDIRDLLYPTKK